VGYLDVVQIEIKEMNLFSAICCHPALAADSPAAPPRLKLLDNCTITMALERNLTARHDIPNNRFVMTILFILIPPLPLHPQLIPGLPG
jgi:hypothetical protein